MWGVVLLPSKPCSDAEHFLKERALVTITCQCFALEGTEVVTSDVNVAEHAKAHSQLHGASTVKLYAHEQPLKGGAQPSKRRSCTCCVWRCPAEETSFETRPSYPRSIELTQILCIHCSRWVMPLLFQASMCRC